MSFKTNKIGMTQVVNDFKSFKKIVKTTTIRNIQIVTLRF